MIYYVGLDIGGTHSRMKIEDETGTILGEFLGIGYSINTNGEDKCREIYREIIIPVLGELKLSPANCGGICVAASGIDNDGLEKACRAIFIEMGFRPEVVKVYNDCEVFLHTSSEASIVLVSGTGSIAFGRSVQNIICRCGGWGHLLSDEGSALDIAKKIFQAVGNHMDERISCPILADLFVKETGFADLGTLNHHLNEYMIEDKAKIACYAQLAEKAAELGDQTARQILLECADALYALVRDIYKKMKVTSGMPITLWLWGSVLTKNLMIFNHVKERAEKELPGLQAKAPLWSALDTALFVAKR